MDHTLYHCRCFLLPLVHHHAELLTFRRFSSFLLDHLSNIMSTLRPSATRLLRSSSPLVSPTSSILPFLPTVGRTIPLKAHQTRALGTSPALSTVKGFASALLHGSEEAREEGKEQHSKVVGRNKVIHEFQKHKVQPQHVETYRKRIAPYYKGIHDSPEFQAKLTGSFEIVTGELDTFVHVWEYEGNAGFEQTKNAIRESQGHLETFNHEILPLLQSRTSQLNREFRFWQTSPPAEKGGIYELRTYQLKPGSLLEWEHEWRVGLEARLATGHYPVGAWFSQVGPLHQVNHMWQYDSLEARGERRAQSWQKDEWSQTVAKTARLTTQMTSQILKPLSFSPLK